MKNEFLAFATAIKNNLVSILGIKDGTDIEATIEGIKRDINFRGPTAWILVFSIFIASIGLNVNSPAVIIGAMLISPLMGPILGVGLSIGTQDIETLFKSLKNLGIAVFIALFTSTLYFVISPLDIAQSELLARTKPTLLDVLIALFGGFAGIVAGSRKEKSNVIPGVAIATALMPPLCTAGFGLSQLNMKYFLGAFYLFFINSVFISLSTYLVVKYLRFPIITYIEKVKMRKYKLMISGFIFLMIIPSTIIFYKVIQESRFNLSAEKFITERCEFEDSQLINKKIRFHHKLSTIDLYYIGEEITKEKAQYLQDMLEYYNISGKERFPVTKQTLVRVHQDKKYQPVQTQEVTEFEEKNDETASSTTTKKKENEEIFNDYFIKHQEALKEKEQQIEALKNQMHKTKTNDSIPFQQILNEMKYLYSDIDKISYSRSIEYFTLNNKGYYDTIPIFMIHFNKNARIENQQQLIENIEEWVKIRLDNPKIKVHVY